MTSCFSSIFYVFPSSMAQDVLEEEQSRILDLAVMPPILSAMKVLDGSRPAPLTWITRNELWFLAAVAPFLLLPGRWTPLAFAVIGLLWLCRWLAWGRLTVRSPMEVPIALLVGATFMGLCVSVDTMASLPQVWLLLLGVSVYYALINVIESEQGLRQHQWLLVVSCLGLALFCLLGTNWSAVRLISLPQFYNRLPAMLRNLVGEQAINPRVAGMTLASLFPVPLMLLLYGRTRSHRLLAGLTVLVMMTTLLLAQSVQAVAGIGAALFVLAVWRSRWFLLALPFGLGAVGWGLWLYGPQRIAASLLSVDHPLGIAVILRLDMWRRAWAMICDMPYTGIGINTFPVLQTGLYPGFLLGPEPHAHNLFLQVALDLGVFGLVVLLWLLIAFGCLALMAYRLCKPQDQEGRALIVGLAAAMVAYVIPGCIDALWTAKSALVLWVLLGLVTASYRVYGLAHEGRAWPRSVRITMALPAVVFLLLLSLGLFFIPSVGHWNLVALRAHKHVLQTRSVLLPEAVLRADVKDLRRVLARDPANVHAYSLLASVCSWLGDYGTAVGALGHRVELDGRKPVGQYAPFEALRRRIQGEIVIDPWEDTLRVYSQWITRYPDRAETYVQAAIVWYEHKHDQARALAVLREGLDRGAQPQGLLHHYLARIVAHPVVS